MSVPSDKIISPPVSEKLSITKEPWNIEIVAHTTKIVPVVAVAFYLVKKGNHQPINKSNNALFPQEAQTYD